MSSLFGNNSYGLGGLKIGADEKAGLASFLVNRLIQQLRDDAPYEATDMLRLMVREYNRGCSSAAMIFADVSTMTHLIDALTLQLYDDSIDDYILNGTLEILDILVSKNCNLASKPLLDALPDLLGDDDDQVKDTTMNLLDIIVGTKPKFITKGFVEAVILKLNNDGCHSASVLGSVVTANRIFAEQIFNVLFPMISVDHESFHYRAIAALQNVIKADRSFATHELFTALIPLLGNVDSMVKLKTVGVFYIMARTEPKFVTQDLVEKLILMSQNDDNDNVRKGAIEYLVEVKRITSDRDIASKIVDALTYLVDNDLNCEVRYDAMVGLDDATRRVKIVKFVAELMQMLKTAPDMEKRRKAMRILIQISRGKYVVFDLRGSIASFVDDLMRKLKSASGQQEERGEAMKILVQLSTEKGGLVDKNGFIDTLTHISSNDTNEDMRKMAAYYLVVPEECVFYYNLSALKVFLSYNNCKV